MEIEKNVVVDVEVYDVVFEGSDLKFNAEVDGDGDIRVTITNEVDEFLTIIGYDAIIEYLESEYPEYKEK